MDNTHATHVDRADRFLSSPGSLAADMHATLHRFNMDRVVAFKRIVAAIGHVQHARSAAPMTSPAMPKTATSTTPLAHQRMAHNQPDQLLRAILHQCAYTQDLWRIQVSLLREELLAAVHYVQKAKEEKKVMAQHIDRLQAELDTLKQDREFDHKINQHRLNLVNFIYNQLPKTSHTSHTNHAESIPLDHVPTQQQPTQQLDGRDEHDQIYAMEPDLEPDYDHELMLEPDHGLDAEQAMLTNHDDCDTTINEHRHALASVIFSQRPDVNSNRVHHDCADPCLADIPTSLNRQALEDHVEEEAPLLSLSELMAVDIDASSLGEEKEPLSSASEFIFIDTPSSVEEEETSKAPSSSSLAGAGAAPSSSSSGFSLIDVSLLVEEDEHDYESQPVAHDSGYDETDGEDCDDNDGSAADSADAYAWTTDTSDASCCDDQNSNHGYEADIEQQPLAAVLGLSPRSSTQGEGRQEEPYDAHDTDDTYDTPTHMCALSPATHAMDTRPAVDDQVEHELPQQNLTTTVVDDEVITINFDKRSWRNVTGRRPSRTLALRLRQLSHVGYSSDEDEAAQEDEVSASRAAYHFVCRSSRRSRRFPRGSPSQLPHTAESTVDIPIQRRVHFVDDSTDDTEEWDEPHEQYVQDRKLELKSDLELNLEIELKLAQALAKAEAIKLDLKLNHEIELKLAEAQAQGDGLALTNVPFHHNVESSEINNTSLGLSLSLRPSASPSTEHHGSVCTSQPASAAPSSRGRELLADATRDCGDPSGHALITACRSTHWTASASARDRATPSELLPHHGAELVCIDDRHVTLRRNRPVPSLRHRTGARKAARDSRTTPTSHDKIDTTQSWRWGTTRQTRQNVSDVEIRRNDHEHTYSRTT